MAIPQAIPQAIPRGNIHTLANMRAPVPFLTPTRRAVFSCQGKPTVAPLDAWIRQVGGCATTKEKGDHFEELCVAYLLHPRCGGAPGPSTPRPTATTTPTRLKKKTTPPATSPGAAPTRPPPANE